jgi:hypothetical protein
MLQFLYVSMVVDAVVSLTFNSRTFLRNRHCSIDMHVTFQINCIIHVRLDTLTEVVASF